MYKFLGISTLLTILFLTTACSTVKGIGKDIQSGAEKVEKLSEDTK